MYLVWSLRKKNVTRSSCRVAGQKSKLSHRHSDVKVKKIKKNKKKTRNAQACSLFYLSPFFSKKWKNKKLIPLFFSFACILSRFRHVQHFVTPWTVARHTPLSMGFSRHEYWSGLPCPSLGDHPHSGTEPMSPALAGGFSTGWSTREALPATNSTKLFIDRKMKSEWCTSALKCYPALNQNGIMSLDG